MENTKIIDMHAHIFPEKIVDKAVKSICDFYSIPMDGKGTTQELLMQAEEQNIEKILVHSTATKPEQVESINRYILGEIQKYDKFIGFGTLHPDYDEIEREAQNMIDNGLKGVKLHPDFQRFNIDDEKAFKIYKVCEEKKLPILFHVGDHRQDFSNPARLSHIMDRFPGLKVIAAHFGGWSVWQHGYDSLESSPNLYFDTSSSLYTLSKEMVYKFIDKHGVDKFFFGSDYPMWTVSQEKERLRLLGMSENDVCRIFYWNAAEFLGIVTKHS